MNLTRLKILAIVLILTGINAIAQGYNPKPNPEAVITSGKARFTVLTSGLIRIEWSKKRKFTDQPSLVFVNRNLPVPNYDQSTKNGTLTITTDKLILNYKVGTGAFTAENLSITLNASGKETTWKPGMENKGNLLGTTRTLDGIDGDSSVYSKSRIELEKGVLSRDGWTLIDDSGKPVFDDSEWAWVEERKQKENQDFYFFAYGKDYKQALADFTSVAGKIALPPRYIFGYWFSRWHPFTEAEYKEMVGQFESLNIPLDVLVMDMDWHATGLKEFFKDGKRAKDKNDQLYGWTGFSWNKNYFPDPAKFQDWAEEHGLKTCLNLHPAAGIHPHEDVYEVMAEKMGVNAKKGEPVQFDIVDKKFAKHYFEQALHPMEKDGVDFWWLDWQQWNNTSIEGVNPTFYLNYVHYSDMERQDKRPLIYHRWGGLGNHRYQIGFSGDTYITWKSLDYQPYFTSTASNVGWGFWGNDVGGFMGKRDEPETTSEELFVRWFQYGTFSPILKTHATCYAPIKRKIWEYSPKNFFHLRQLIQMRRELIPYIYHNARKAYDTGISLCRPMYYEYPEDQRSYDYKNEYFFGDDMIVNPVTKPIAGDSLFVEQTTWIPEGEWIEWFTGKEVKGDAEVFSAFAYDEMPVYCKKGSIVPTMDYDVKAGEIPEKLILNIFDGKAGKLDFYEDNGDDNGFKNGEYAITPVSFKKEGNKLVVNIDPVKGSYKGMPTERFYEVRLVNQLFPKSVVVNGSKYEFSENGGENAYRLESKKLTTHIYLPKASVGKPVKIEIELIDGDTKLLSGMVQKMSSMYKFSKFLAERRNFWKQDEWNDAYYSSDVVKDAAATAIKLEREPLKMVEILTKFDEQYNSVISMLQEMNKEHQKFESYLELLESIK